MCGDTNQNDFTPNSDGSSQTEANNTNTITNKGNASDAQDKVDGYETSQPKKSNSEARLRANRKNSLKSTGPKTARGKDFSRRNAVKHGFLSKQLLFSHDGQPINEELHQLWESLHEKYGDDDIRTNLLVDGLVVEHWRQRQALAIEVSCYKSVAEAQWHYGPQGTLPNLQRYRTASQHALFKNLELLEELPPPASEGEEDDGEGETSTPQSANPHPALEETSDLTVVGDKQCSPDCGSQSENEAASGEDSTPTGERREAT